MAGDRWGTWFWTAMDATSGTEVNKAYGFQALELTESHAIIRWSPSREVFTYLPDSSGQTVADSTSVNQLSEQNTG